MHSEYKIISVESRKGGVGKTTAAINLASLLYERGYNVLLIDLDITGTSISHACQSLYWKDLLHLVTIDNKDVNFLEEFKDNYLLGNESVTFSSVPNNTKSLIIRSDKVNVLSSNLYDDNNGEILCDPRIIFDELHSYWLTEYIKTTCDSFSEVSGERTVVILDNSPGFIGLGKSIHEWLTDLGPARGKFLTLSSLDIQDIKSCLSSIKIIAKIIDYKHQGAIYYKTLKKNTKKSNVEPEKEVFSFFLKLSNEEFDDSTLSYWLNENNKPDIDEYQSLIINKAPKELKSNLFYFNTSELYSNELDGSLYDLISDLSKVNSQKRINNIIFFDDFISNQFIERYIEKSLSKKQRTVQKNSWLKGYFTKLENELTEKDNSNIKYSPRHFFDNIDSYDHNITLIIKHLKEAGYNNIARLIDEDWLPKAPFDRVQHLFDNLSDYTFLLGNYARARIRLDYSEFNQQPFNDVFANLNLSKYLPSYQSEITINKIIHSFKTLWYYIVGPFMQKYEEGNKFSPLTSMIETVFKIQYQRYRSLMMVNNSLNFKGFLAIESLKFKDINTSLKEMFHNNNEEKFLNNQDLDTLFRMSLSDDEKSAALFADFYNAFCNAQARIMDIDKDYDFLLFILKNTTVNEFNIDGNIYPNIQPLVNSVIVDKNIPHSIAKEKFKEEISRAKKMIEFKKVLEQCVINKWGL